MGQDGPQAKRAAAFVAPLTWHNKPSLFRPVTSILNGNPQDLERTAKLASISLELAQIEARTNRSLGHFAEAERQFRTILPQLPVNAQPAIDIQLAFIAIDSGRYQEGLVHLVRLEPTFTGMLKPKLGVL